MVFQIRQWPTVILHLDADAFFASVVQVVNPSLKGKPVVTGRERGIATAVSYEAKKYGVKRGMRISEVKNICPSCVITSSDYETYSLFSNKIFRVLERFSPIVEKYSIDEGFADLKGLRRPLNMSYFQIGKAIKDKVESSLGITVSVGIAPTKSLAKIASSFQKPSGLTLIDGLSIEKFLKERDLIDIWGIGENTASYLQKLGVRSALDFVLRSENFIKKNLSKSYFEIWQELRGNQVYRVNPNGKSSQKEISHTRTFYPPINEKEILWARILEHVEEVFSRARYMNYVAGRLSIFLKTQGFGFYRAELKFSQKTDIAYFVKKQVRNIFEKIHKQGVLYRASGCTLSDFKDNWEPNQQSLFEANHKEERIKKVYDLYERGKIDFASSFLDKKRDLNARKSTKLTIPFISPDEL